MRPFGTKEIPWSKISWSFFTYLSSHRRYSSRWSPQVSILVKFFVCYPPRRSNDRASVPDTAPPAPTLECSLTNPRHSVGRRDASGVHIVVGYRLRLAPHGTHAQPLRLARTPTSLGARRFTPLVLSEYGAPPTEGEGVPVWLRLCVWRDAGVGPGCSGCPPPLCGGGDPAPTRGEGPVTSGVRGPLRAYVVVSVERAV